MLERRQDLASPSHDGAAGNMVPSATALVLVGFQNDYFGDGGALRGGIADTEVPARVLATTVSLLDRLAATDTCIVAAPMVFAPTYADLVDPVGALAAIKARDAFRVGTDGVGLADALRRFGPRMVTIGGRHGLSAFADTTLDADLAAREIRDVVIAGALTCVSIDATGRAAYERGYRVTVLSDCTMGRTRSEHRLFCERIFPLYAEVVTSDQVADRLQEAS